MHLYRYFTMYYTFVTTHNKIFITKYQIKFSNNFDRKNYLKCLPKYNFFGFLFGNKLFKLGKILYSIFKLNKNIIIIDHKHNYNYLPIKNSDLFSRSVKNYKKYLTYFSVSALIFFNLNKKKFIFKKLQGYKLINIAVGLDNHLGKFDLSLNFKDNKLTYYCIYIFIINIYLGVKNNNLNINGSTLYFF